MSLHGAPRTHSKIRDWHLIASPQQAMEDADAETVSARDASEAEQHCDQCQSCLPAASMPVGPSSWNAVARCCAARGRAEPA